MGKFHDVLLVVIFFPIVRRLVVVAVLMELMEVILLDVAVLLGKNYLTSAI